MGFRSISVEEKIAVIYEVTKKGKIEPVARSYGVSKPSVYTWLERSQEALRKALKPHKRGPKFKRNPENKRMEELASFLEEKDGEIKRLREKSNPKKEDIRPVKCPYCGFEKIYRNGTYKRKPKAFFDKLKQDEQKEESVPDFLCPWCGKSFHMEKKGASFTLT